MDVQILAGRGAAVRVWPERDADESRFRTRTLLQVWQNMGAYIQTEQTEHFEPRDRRQEAEAYGECAPPKAKQQRSYCDSEVTTTEREPLKRRKQHATRRQRDDGGTVDRGTTTRSKYATMCLTPNREKAVPT
ncbi:hypothetical protein E6O75_ATG08493 [Venturia nashicola]|uniref:Uncharacterized protein n=1 Tax=Venturia nashicola TaxID=86259 RepID=A0A4Z1P4V5_9PEZI|nr:hypothetical protein E6O75_ATG08493 [Venturia nashicola]